MKSNRLAFQSWCSRAASHIRFKADRPDVELELLEHMEDHFDALVQEGLTAQETERQTLAAMGDADETGAALAKVHKPYLGWLYVAAKWLVALSAVLLLMVSCSTGMDFSGYGFPEPFQGLATESDETYRREITYLYPNCTDKCNGYTFSLPVVAHRRGTWVEKQENMPQTYEAVYFVLEAAHPLPWAGSPDGLRESIYAVDSEGNLYPSRCQKVSHSDYEEREVCGNPVGRTLLRYRFQMWISTLDPDAEWVELRYGRMGYSFALRIDLTEGGDAA